MRIRSKLVVLIAVPLLALGFVAVYGFRGRSVAIETAEEAAETVRLGRAVNDAVLAIGDERLARLGADMGPASDMEVATDAALAHLSDEIGQNDSDMTETVAATAGLVDRARSALDEEAIELLTEANADLLTLDIDSADDYGSAAARNSAIVDRLMVASLEATETAWIGYLDAGVEEADVAAVSSDFARSTSAWSLAVDIATGSSDSLFEDSMAAQAGRQLEALQAVALDDLVEGERSIDETEVVDALSEFRAVWAPAVDGHGLALQALVGAELEEQNDVRSLFSLLALVGALVLAGLIFVMYRSITLPLSELLGRANRVATVDLPNLMAMLQSAEGDDELPQATPIPVTTDDEIGELVAAFNDVQLTAYELATEQAVSRRLVGELYVNLGRRNQSLVQRILGRLTELERQEENPETLSKLFELDNMVTRLRRNAENLLALAGAHTARQWSQPVEIDTTIRAAFGEVEGYERIEIGSIDSVQVSGGAVADITHLVAELLENALSFSESTTEVTVFGQLLDDSYEVAIVDRGVGMTGEELEDLNDRVANPPPLNQVPTNLLGLYVVGRLAERYGIDVRLEHGQQGGTVASVILPADVLVGVGPDQPIDADVVGDSSPSGRAVAADTSGELGGDALPQRTVGAAVEPSSPLEVEHDLDAELASLTVDPAGDDVASGDALAGDVAGDEPAGDEPAGDDVAGDALTADDVAGDELAGDVAADGLVGDDLGELPTRGRSAVADEDLGSEDAITDQAAEIDGDDTFTGANGDATSEPGPQAQEGDAAEEEADLGSLPVRSRGESLDSTPAPAPPETGERRAETDNSVASADAFSSMLSALSTGIRRGETESQTPIEEGADQ